MSQNVPSDRDCYLLWDSVNMLPNIRHHSKVVAHIATMLAQLTEDSGPPSLTPMTRAAALLHDLGKTYTISHGGNHCQIGGALVQAHLGIPIISQSVVHHVYWPYEINASKFFIPLVVLYSDKRVCHDTIVSMRDRYEDIMVRYGINNGSAESDVQAKIKRSYTQALAIEQELSTFLGVNLHEYSFDSGRLV